MILKELEKLPKTKREAEIIGSKFYFTGEKCSNGHIAKRHVSSYNCYECGRESQARHSQKPFRKIQERAKSKKYRDSPKGKETLRAYESTELRKRARKNTILRFEYGITLDQYEEMYLKQNGLCEICSDFMDSSTRRLSPCVDHNHTTGKVRGLICAACNKAISHLKESPQILQSAIRYLRRHSI